MWILIPAAPAVDADPEHGRSQKVHDAWTQWHLRRALPFHVQLMTPDSRRLTALT